MIAIFFMADRYLKFLAVNSQGEPAIELVGSFFSFNFIPNYYIAFSLPLQGFWLNSVISLIILAIIAFLIKSIRNKENKLFISGLSLILIGAISNLIDRLQSGYVIDYLYLKHFTVFNLADVCISLGAIIILFSLNKKPSR